MPNPFSTCLCIALCTLTVAWAGETVFLTSTPAVLKGLPGEPLSVTLTVDSAHPWPVHVQVPVVSNLVLRSVERIPVQRTPPDFSEFMARETAGPACLAEASAARRRKAQLYRPAVGLALRADRGVHARPGVVSDRRTPGHRYIQSRILLWQGVEPGSVVITNLSASLNGGTHHFPPVKVTILPVTLPSPPQPPAETDTP